MGSPGLPNMAIQQLMQRLSGGQAASGAPGVATGTPPGTPSGSAVSQQLSELQTADPQQGQNYLEEMITKLSALINQYALRIPGAAQSGARALPALQRMLKEIKSAAQTQSAMGGPIQASAARLPQPGGAGMSPAGGMGGPVGPVPPAGF